VRINAEGTSFKVLGVDIAAPTPELRRDFNLDPHEKITKIARVRMAYGRPLAYVTSYLPARLLEKVPRDRLLKHPLTNIVEEQLGHKVAGLKLVVSAKLADRRVATQLEIPTGSPVLLVERNYLHNRRLILRTAGYYRSDLFGYEIRLRRGGR
jgi:GntR family transcriptional regulator